MTLIFSVDIRWKAFAAKKTVTLFVESVKNTQLSEGDRAGEVAHLSPNFSSKMSYMNFWSLSLFVPWVTTEPPLIAQRKHALLENISIGSRDTKR
jgi:hypothetical protein